MEKNHVTRKLTIREFFKRFPSDDVCLARVMDVRFGLRHVCRKCGQDSTFHRLENRKAYACAHCGDNLYPCAGTIFEDTRTSLQVWFYALYLFSVSRNGVAAMELHRQLGVTYKTAWRMAGQIRSLMEKADTSTGMIGGSGKHVEADEMFVGGRVTGQGRGYAPRMSNKTVVMGMKERGGRIRTTIVPDVKLETLRAVFNANVKPGTIVSTDEHKGYNLLVRDGFIHGTVTHKTKEYVREDELGNVYHTNSLENFWGHFKASVRGTHVHISQKHMPKYLGEFTFRANHRHVGNAMFDALLAAL